jgi:hypothetical protein
MTTTLNINEIERRPRPQFSCTACHAGKLKCDRTLSGCDQCLKRGREASCQYVVRSVPDKPKQNARARVRRLEKLVKDLMKSKEVSSGIPHPSIQAPVPQPPKSTETLTEPDTFGYGKLSIEKNETSYVGDSHWMAILNEVIHLNYCIVSNAVDQQRQRFPR